MANGWYGPRMKNLITRIAKFSSKGRFNSISWDSKTEQASLLLIFAAGLWLFEVSSWSFFVLLGFCRLLPRRISLGMLALFLISILPLDRLVTTDDCPLDSTTARAASQERSEDDECGFSTIVRELTSASGEEIKVDGWVKNGAFNYPAAAMLFETEFTGEAVYQVNKNGRAIVDTLQNATASNVKPLFEDAIVSYIEEGFVFQTEFLDETSFPLTGELRMYFQFEDQLESFRFPTWSIVEYLAFLIIAGFLCGEAKSLRSFVATVSTPYGVYITALCLFVAIKSALTTKYLFLAEALTIGSFFVVLGSLAWISGGGLNRDFRASDISPLRKVLAIAVLTMSPILALSESIDARLIAFLFSDFAELHLWQPDLSESFYRQQSILTYILQIFFSWQFMSSIFLYLFIGVLGRATSWRGRTTDFYLLISAALVVYSIIYWFASIDRITENYAAIFVALEIGALALILCPLALITVSLAPKLDQIKRRARSGRRNLLLVELFAFFLFFAYAPVSISELGQSFEADVRIEKERKDTQTRIRRIEERLDIPSEVKAN